MPHLVFSGGDTSVSYEITKEVAEALESVRGQAKTISYQQKNPHSAKRELNLLAIVFLVIFAPLFIIPIFVLPLLIAGPILLTGAGAFAWAVVRYKPIDPYVSSVLRVDTMPGGVTIQTAAETYLVGAKDVVVLIMPRKPDDHATLVTRVIPSPFVLTPADAGRVRDHYSGLGEPVALF